MNWAQAYLILLVVVALLAPWLASDTAAPIPFRAETTALTGARYAPPGTPTADGRRHYLGTDRLGRDTAAGLVAGTRVAVLVGAGSLVLALLIGLPLGAVAGFFGDGGLQLPRAGLIALILGALVGSGYFWGSLAGLAEGPVRWVLLWMCCVGVVTAGSYLLLRAVARWVIDLRKPVGLPVDRVVVLLIELVSSIPGLVLLIAVLSLVRAPSLWLVVLIIGLIGWTSIARFLRAELLRIRELPYIAAARITGVGEWSLLWRHALPNAIGPLVVVAAFFVGSSILAEAMLSFLGVGVPADQVTWGSMLQQSRARPEAWWLAVFPGLLLTLTVLACNRLRKQ